MNSKTIGQATDGREQKQGKDKDEGALEKIAQFIDPPGREISDAELSDPGANTPAPKPDRIPSDKKPSDRKSS